MTSTIASNWPARGFMLAGLVNIVGILVVTQGLQSPTLSSADPAVFSFFGLLLIMVWGLAYLAAAPFASQSVAIPLVFAIEKLAYTVAWLLWRSNTTPETLEAIVENDVLGGLFMSSYGINDGLFMVFFLAVAVVNFRRSRQRN